MKAVFYVTYVFGVMISVMPLHISVSTADCKSKKNKRPPYAKRLSHAAFFTPHLLKLNFSAIICALVSRFQPLVLLRVPRLPPRLQTSVTSDIKFKYPYSTQTCGNSTSLFVTAEHNTSLNCNKSINIFKSKNSY